MLISFIQIQYSWVEHDEGFVTIADDAAGLSPEEEAIVAQMMGGDLKDILI